MKIWMRRIVKAGREGFEGEMVAELNYYANRFAGWCVENVPKQDLPLAIAAIENALEIMKEVELNETGRDIVETTRNITATIAIQVKKEQE